MMSSYYLIPNIFSNVIYCFPKYIYLFPQFEHFLIFLDIQTVQNL